jgi:hypothetical protein
MWTVGNSGLKRRVVGERARRVGGTLPPPCRAARYQLEASRKSSKRRNCHNVEHCTVTYKLFEWVVNAWDETPCTVTRGHRSFGDGYCIQLQGRRVKWVLRPLLHGLTLRSWKLRHCVFFETSVFLPEYTAAHPGCKYSSLLSHIHVDWKVHYYLFSEE